MSLRNFIAYLQQLLTMVDPKDEASYELARKALEATVELAFASGKADSVTLRAMRRAQDEFFYLVKSAEDFAGKPGHFRENEQKRHRLESVIVPHC